MAPVLHEVKVLNEWWFVPNRILWDDWESFITTGADGDDSTSHPTVAITSHGSGNLKDYLGIPPYSGSTKYVNALPFRAYALIYNEFYRDQNLQDELDISYANGVDSITSQTLKHRNWEKDYFTSALPTPQLDRDWETILLPVTVF